MAADDLSKLLADDSNDVTPRAAASTSPFDLTLRSTSREPLVGLTDPGSADLVQIRPIEWESLTSVGQDEDGKEYQTDSELQSIINELASRIAPSESDAERQAAGRRAGPAARSYGGAGVVSAPPEVDEPVDLGELTVLDPVELDIRPAARVEPADEPVTAPAAGPEPESALVVEPAPVLAAVAAEPLTAEENEPELAEQATVADVEPVSPPMAEAVAEAPASASPDEPMAEVAAVGVTGETPVLPAVAAAAGPVELPIIAEATPVPVVPAVPSPAAPPAPAAVAAPTVPPVAAAAPLLPKIEPKPGAGRPTQPIDFHSLLGDGGSSPKPPVKKRRRKGRFGSFLKLVVVLGLLAGAAYVGKVYFLDQQWPDEIEPIAKDVAEQRGLEWERAVEVETLAPGVYALRLAESMLGVTAADTAALSVEWRAMGLAEGSIDLAAIGSAALADQPAFYDPADETVYVIEGLSGDLREIVLTRALGNALLDQHFDWGTTIETASGESVRLGVRALFDGDALALTSDMVATLLADPARASAVTAELATLRAEAASLARGASPYASAIVGRSGDPTRHLFSSAMTPTPISRSGAEELAVPSDASVYDGVRSRTSTPVGLTAVSTPEPVLNAVGEPTDSIPGVRTAGPARMAGMIYWYYVLAGRLDSTTAWNAALAWNGDITEQALLPDGRCVSSTIATFDEAGQQRLLGALQQWAAAAPVESATTVSVGADLTVMVTSCDPGPTADTLSNTQIAPFGNAEAELVVAGDLLSAGLPRSEAARICVINAVRGFGVPALVEPASVDPALAEPQLDLTSQAARDLMAGCGNA